MSIKFDLSAHTGPDRVLSQMTSAPDPETDKICADLIEATSAVVARDVEGQVIRAVNIAEADLQTAIRRAESHRPTLEATVRDTSMLPRGSIVRATVAFAGFMIALPAEWQLNAQVLPWINKVDPYSLGGIAICVAPVLATIGLELGLSQIFETDHAWDAPTNEPPSWRTRARWAWRRAPFFVLGTVSIGVPLLVARLRPLRTIFDTVRERTPDQLRQIVAQMQPAIDSAMVWLAVGLVLTSAILYIYAMAQYRHAWRCWRGGRWLRQQQRRQDELDTAVERKTAECAALRKIGEEPAVTGELVSRAWALERLWRLAQLRDAPAPIGRQVSRVFSRQEVI